MNSLSYLRLLHTNLKCTGIFKNMPSLPYGCNYVLRQPFFRQQSSSNYSKEASSQKVVSGETEDTLERDEHITKEIVSRVNTQITEKTHGRLFAVVLLHGKKYKITVGDILAIAVDFAIRTGDNICLEKVLLVGSKDFTVIGRPLLSKDLIRIEATVIERTYCVPRPIFRFLPRQRYRRLHWFRTPYILLRINSINFQNKVDGLPSVEGLENRVIY